MAEGILLFGDGKDLDAASAALAAGCSDLTPIPVQGAGNLASRARDGGFSVAVVLPGPITEHDRRIAAVASLRREGFRGRLLFAGAFLTEKEQALAAGADFVFDPKSRPVEAVIARALRRPSVAADHPYLRFLLARDWASLEAYSTDLPARPPAVLLASVSCHKDPAFWDALSAYAAAHPATRCFVVEDDDDPDVTAAVMACGVQPYVSLADRGLLHLHALVRHALHEI